MRVLRRLKLRRRYLAILVLFAVIGTVAVVWYDIQAQSAMRNAQGVAPLPSPYCRKDDPLASVANPIRYSVINRCTIGSGHVASITQNDGDHLVNVTLDESIDQSRLLILEITPQDQGAITIPSVGQHIKFVGQLVYDHEEGWKAMIPVWSITPVQN